MKTIKNLILVAAVLVSTLSYADKGNGFKTTTYSKITVVEFENVKKGQQLIVKDNDGEIMYSEIIDSNGTISKTFDLKYLKDGNYTLELDKDFEIVVKPFKVTKNQILFSTSEETKKFKPLVVNENSQLRISKLNLELEPVEIEIYYDGDLIYSEVINKETIVNRVYKLSEFETGNYYTIVTVKDRSYTNYFKM